MTMSIYDCYRCGRVLWICVLQPGKIAKTNHPNGSTHDGLEGNNAFTSNSTLSFTHTSGKAERNSSRLWYPNSNCKKTSGGKPPSSLESQIGRRQSSTVVNFPPSKAIRKPLR